MDWITAGKKILADYTGEDAKKARLLLADCKKSGLDPSAALDRIAKEIVADRPQDMRAAADPDGLTNSRSASAEAPAADPVPRESRRGKRGKDKTKRARRSDAAPPKPKSKEALRQWWHDRAMESLPDEPEKESADVIQLAEIVPTDDVKALITEYSARIDDIARTYIDTIRQGDTRRPEKWFPDMVYYISDRMPDYGKDIRVLDGIWSIYCRLCSRVGIVPTIQHFATFSKVGNTTLYDWSRGDDRQLTPAYRQTVKKWQRQCQDALSADVTTSDGASVNKIFVLKAAYGWTETAPVQRVEHIQTGAASYPVLGDINTDN